MSPALEHGDFVITKKPRRFTPGSFYVFDHPKYGRMVKRLVSETDLGLTFEGLNARSTSTDKIGLISAETVKAQAVWRIAPNGISRLKP